MLKQDITNHKQTVHIPLISLPIAVNGAIADLCARFGNGNEFQYPSERRGFSPFVAANPLTAAG